MNIDVSSVVIPITQEEAGFATLLLCGSNEPVYKVRTILIVLKAVRLQSKMDVRKNSRFLKKVTHNPIITKITANYKRIGVILRI
jgi:hypothetical protein